MTSSHAEPRLRAPSGAAPPRATRVEGVDIDIEPLAREACRRYRSEHPDEAARFGGASEAWCVHDMLYLIAWAADDVRLGGGQLAGNVTWLARVLQARRFPLDRLVRGLELAGDVVADAGLPRAGALAQRLRGAASAVVVGVAPERPPAGSPVRDAYLAALLRADPRGARIVVDAALDSGVSVPDLYLTVFQEALYEVGRLWQNGQATVAQEHLATATTQTLVARLSERLSTPPRPELTAVLSATQDDLHALGTRFVGDFLESDGWTAIDLGAATPTQDLLRTVAAQRPKLVCLSTALTTHLLDAERAIADLRALDAPPLIAVGGHAYADDPGLAERVGADIHAPDAATFLQLLRERCGEAR